MALRGVGGDETRKRGGMRIELEVSDENEGTESPWWSIIDPRQNMRTGQEACHNIAGMITGPFFSREAAQEHLETRRYNFGKNAVVFCHSGHWSRQYKEACRARFRTE